MHCGQDDELLIAKQDDAEMSLEFTQHNCSLSQASVFIACCFVKL
jgi:hypothetical protein